MLHCQCIAHDGPSVYTRSSNSKRQLEIGNSSCLLLFRFKREYENGYQFFLSRQQSYIEHTIKTIAVYRFYVHSNHGSGSATAASLRPPNRLLVGIYLDLTVLFSLFYSRLYLCSEAGPGLERQRDSQRSRFTTSMAFVVGVCLCKSFEQIFFVRFAG